MIELIPSAIEADLTALKQELGWDDTYRGRLPKDGPSLYLGMLERWASIMNAYHLVRLGFEFVENIYSEYGRFTIDTNVGIRLEYSGDAPRLPQRLEADFRPLFQQMFECRLMAETSDQRHSRDRIIGGKEKNSPFYMWAGFEIQPGQRFATVRTTVLGGLDADPSEEQPWKPVNVSRDLETTDEPDTADAPAA
jgi:hypothetical protein